MRDRDRPKKQLIDEIQNLRSQLEQCERIKQEKELISQYLDIAGVMIVAIDVEGSITLINRKGSKILGWDHDDIIGKNWFDHFLPSRFRESVRSVHRRLVAGEISPVEFYENPIVTGDGEERLISWHNTLIKDDNGKPVGTLSSGSDITEKKQAERALEESESRFRKLVETMRDGLMVIDLNFRITYVNDRFCDMAEYPREELLDKDANAMFAESSSDLVTKQLEKRKLGIADSYEATLLKKSGGVLLFSFPEVPSWTRREPLWARSACLRISRI